MEIMRNIYEKKLSNDIVSSVMQGDKGEFTVKYGDNIIFDKSKKNRFPEKDEIVKLIK